MRALLLAVLLCVLSAPALAQEKEPAVTPDHHKEQVAAASDIYDAARAGGELQAQSVIDAFWSLSQEDRESGNTECIRRGALMISQCMRGDIIFLSENVVFKNSPETQKEIRYCLDKIHNGIGRLYWDLYNSQDVCRESPCGTMWTVLHNNEVAHVMEQIVIDFYLRIDENRSYYG